VGDWATVGALCPVHHFVRIGAHAFIGGGTTITRDVLPFSKTSAERGTHAYGLNAVGLERRGFTKERIGKIHHAYRLLLASKLNTSQALEKLRAEPDIGEDVEMLIRFIEASERGVINSGELRCLRRDGRPRPSGCTERVRHGTVRSTTSASFARRADEGVRPYVVPAHETWSHRRQW